MEDYKWQLGALLRFTKSKIGAIIAACGTGKTRVGIKLGLAKLLPIIIITPKNISRQWRDDILEVAGKDQKVWLYDATTEHKNTEKYAKEFLEWCTPSEEEINAMEERANGRHD